MVDLSDIRDAREWGLHFYRDWKAQIGLNDSIVNDDWEILWDNDEQEPSEPLVENIYKQTLEDKIASAGSVLPQLIVPPRRGTRRDRAESEAQKRRRILVSHWERSKLRRNMKSLYQDWFHTGAIYTTPWTDWVNPATGNRYPSNQRFPYILQLDPRQAIPLTHDSKKNLTSIMFIRQRRAADLEREYGLLHPGLVELRSKRQRQGFEESEFLEEIWWFDSKMWAVAFADSHLPAHLQGRQWVSEQINEMYGLAKPNVAWATQPEEHRLVGCPVREAKRTTADGSYRGAIEDIIPVLKVAQNFMARLLEDLSSNIFAPVVLDNVEDPHEWGPGAVMVGTGEGTANIVRDRPPVNFEAQQVVGELLSQARRQAFEPAQRAGDPEASIVSAKGVNALTGTFNVELAWAQADMEDLLEDTNVLLANFDEKWCSGTKSVIGFEKGRPFEETYDAASLFKGDYRNKVTYGDHSGLDRQTYLTYLATMRNLGGMSLRTFMEKSAGVEDVLQEERDMAIENLTSLFQNVILPQTIQGGDLDALRRYVDKIDSDQMTVREAVMETINEMLAPVPTGNTVSGEAPGAGGQLDVTRMMRSLASGGIPGQAEGLPLPGRELRDMLPAQAGRALSEVQPGGTAA